MIWQKLLINYIKKKRGCLNIIGYIKSVIQNISGTISWHHLPLISALWQAQHYTEQQQEAELVTYTLLIIIIIITTVYSLSISLAAKYVEAEHSKSYRMK